VPASAAGSHPQRGGNVRELLPDRARLPCFVQRASRRGGRRRRV